MATISLPHDIEAAFAAENRANRVFSLMGPNGSGKSKLLEKTQGHLRAKSIPCLLLPSVRSLSEFNRSVETSAIVPDVPEGDGPDAHWWRLLRILFDPSAQSQSRNQGPGFVPLTFGSALSHLLWYVSHEQTKRAKKYLAEHAEFKAGRRQSPAVPPDTDAVVTLRTKIEDILRYPTKIEETQKQGIGGAQGKLVITFERNGSSFSPEGLSDGEKQILLLSIFLVGRRDDAERLVFLVDEPELFLNEALAIEIWQRLEHNFPNAIFLYATHNPNFATRNGVHQSYVMSRNGDLERLDTTLPIPPHMRREIVGTRVQLLRTDAHPIFCEDVLAQSILYDVFATDKCVILPLHNRDTVISAVRKEHGWDLLRSEGPKHCGVIDRDTADEQEVGKLEKMGVFCFPRYEAESFLLDSKIAIWAIALAGPDLSSSEYTQMIVDCGRTRLELMLRKLAVHVSRQQSHAPLRFTAGETSVENVRMNPTDTLIPKFEQRAATLYAALSDRDVDAILTNFKGKCLYSTMQGLLRSAHKYDLPEPRQWYLQMRASKGFEKIITEVSWLSAFRTKVEDFLAT